MKLSRFAPVHPQALPAIDGVRIGTCEAGIKYKNRRDLMLMAFDAGTSVAGVFTRSKTAGAPVEWCRTQLAGRAARALVVNSGNSNAFTGAKGRQTVSDTANAAAKAVGCEPGAVFIASTGVIGQPFDAGVISKQLPGLAKSASGGNWADAAAAIMTTDTYAKMATRTAKIGGVEVTLNGIAKGSGMIAPDMATMLSFIATDAPISSAVLQEWLQVAADKSFNAISVDGDTSTSDTLLVFATHAAARRGAPLIDSADNPCSSAFREALEDLTHDLAMQVIKDGEGISKFVTLEISGAETPQAARRIGMSIANSPLVKTAIAGNDPNWGRLVMAVGKSGEAADRDTIAIRFGDIQVAKDGGVVPGYTETAGAEYFKRPEIVLSVDVGVGQACATVYTCDLTADYVSINADYRS
jgi:glutamate N-acetyltransferase / amino-acid N-acetyltransferase